MALTIVEVRSPRLTRQLATTDELSPREILERFGLRGRHCTVTIWPEGRPDLARVIQRPAE